VESWQWALVLKPLFFMLVCALILYPARRAVMRWLPEGRLKRILLFRWD
jgi:hypothetical protein